MNKMFIKDKYKNKSDRSENVNFTKKIHIAVLIIGMSAVFGYFKLKDVQSDTDSMEYYEEISEDFEDEKLKDNENAEGSESEKRSESDKPDENSSIIVDIKGAVANPGIIEAESGCRIADIVSLSGGFTDNADINAVNLAKTVEDEDMIYIPFKGEKTESGESYYEYSDSESRKPDKNDNSGDTVNINTADKEELKKLNGVGDATAEKIIDYREENKFECPEDIMNVSGIGEKKFESMKDFITVK